MFLDRSNFAGLSDSGGPGSLESSHATSSVSELPTLAYGPTQMGPSEQERE